MLSIIIILLLLYIIGVNLFHNGMNIVTNHSAILITDIGTSLPHQLVCTTDKIPCCQDSPQYGEWYFPDQTQVMEHSEESVTFYRNRDNNGNVNLFRVDNNVMSPTGRFCCVVEDASDTNQTHCIDIGEAIILLYAVII